VLEIVEYTFEEFSGIVVEQLRKKNVDESTAVSIAVRVWNELASRY
jgi:hypothetical protein